jgi:hypothetical protein
MTSRDPCPECGTRSYPTPEEASAESLRIERLEREIAELRDAVADADGKWAEARIEATRVKMDAHGLRKAYERACSRLVALGEHPPTYDDSEEEA